MAIVDMLDRYRIAIERGDEIAATNLRENIASVCDAHAVTSRVHKRKVDAQAARIAALEGCTQSAIAFLDALYARTGEGNGTAFMLKAVMGYDLSLPST